jgi:hypothetical protein
MYTRKPITRTLNTGNILKPNFYKPGIHCMAKMNFLVQFKMVLVVLTVYINIHTFLFSMIKQSKLANYHVVGPKIKSYSVACCVRFSKVDSTCVLS